MKILPTLVMLLTLLLPAAGNCASTNASCTVFDVTARQHTTFEQIESTARALAEAGDKQALSSFLAREYRVKATNPALQEVVGNSALSLPCAQGQLIDMDGVPAKRARTTLFVIDDPDKPELFKGLYTVECTMQLGTDGRFTARDVKLTYLEKIRFVKQAEGTEDLRF